jgi:hypothetical protein
LREEATKYDFTEIDELTELGLGTIRGLSFRMEQPSVAIIIGRGGGSAIAFRPDAAVRGVIAQIEELMTSRRQRLAPFVNRRWFISALLVSWSAGLATWLPVYGSSQLGFWAKIAVNCVGSVGSLLLLAIGVAYLHGHVRIVNRRRDTLPSFWEAHRATATNAVIAFSAAIIGALATLLIERLVPKH